MPLAPLAASVAQAPEPVVIGETFQNESKVKRSASSPAGKCELRALTLARFYCINIEEQLQFNKASRGRVVGVTAEWADHNAEFKRVK